MTIRQLEYFCAVAEENSISAAARKMHMAQPPVSRQIALLEHELGVQLFRRGNKGMYLTQAGQSLYQQGRQLVGEMERMVEYVRALDSGIYGVVRIGALYSTVSYALAQLRAYHERYPQVELYIRLATPQELIGELNRGSLHALFLRSGSQEPSGLHERILGEDPLKLIMTAQSDPCPGQDPVPISRLADVPMCLLRSDDLWGYHDILLKQCQRNGFSPHVVCQCYDTPMAMQLVQSGFGVSFLPESILNTHPNSGIYAKAVQGLPVSSYALLAWDKHSYHASCVERFLDLTP